MPELVERIDIDASPEQVWAALTDWEPFEGMLVTLPQALSVAEYFQFGRFNETVLTVGRQPTPKRPHEIMRRNGIAVGKPGIGPKMEDKLRGVRIHVPALGQRRLGQHGLRGILGQALVQRHVDASFRLA